MASALLGFCTRCMDEVLDIGNRCESGVCGRAQCELRAARQGEVLLGALGREGGGCLAFWVVNGLVQDLNDVVVRICGLI